MEGPTREGWQSRYTAYVEAGVPELLARMVAGTTHLYTLLPIIEAADVSGHDAAEVARAYFAVGSALELPWYLQQISDLPVANNWQAAREAFRDDVDWQQRAITISALQVADAPQDMEARVALWNGGGLRYTRSAFYTLPKLGFGRVFYFLQALGVRREAQTEEPSERFYLNGDIRQLLHPPLKLIAEP
nr:NAD-glutamate dehydrogenase [Pseudomonas protegens]